MVSPTNREVNGRGWTDLNGLVHQEDLEQISGLCGHLHNSVSFRGVRIFGSSVGELERAVEYGDNP